jgi:uncharacterized membrane protein YedE/YeeE
LFGLGLVTSHMTDPDVIVGFLDIAGDWNPSLLFVMAGAVAVAMPAFVVARQRPKALLGDPIVLPDRTKIDKRLTAGAAIFGVGWGLAGICPGPGIVLLGTLDTGALVFIPAVLVGMLGGYFGVSGILKTA